MFQVPGPFPHSPAITNDIQQASPGFPPPRWMTLIKGALDWEKKVSIQLRTQEKLDGSNPRMAEKTPKKKDGTPQISVLIFFMFLF